VRFRESECHLQYRGRSCIEKGYCNQKLWVRNISGLVFGQDIHSSRINELVLACACYRVHVTSTPFAGKVWLHFKCGILFFLNIIITWHMAFTHARTLLHGTIKHPCTFSVSFNTEPLHRKTTTLHVTATHQDSTHWRLRFPVLTPIISSNKRESHTKTTHHIGSDYKTIHPHHG
jgi:hypothetical protein